MINCRMEPTVAPLTFRSIVDSNAILSSFNDDSYRTSVNIFRQLAVKGRNNRIPVGNCGMSTVNLSQLLSCLGLTVQETTTLTATVTITNIRTIILVIAEFISVKLKGLNELNV